MTLVPMLEWVFWISVVLISYTYVGFPILALLRGRLCRHPYHTTEITPTVSMVIAAHNEATNIAAKLDNIISLDYPRDQLQAVIVSDGSTDDTDQIIKRYTSRGIRLLSVPRIGKARAINSAVAVSTGDILVFSDANSMYAPDALRALVQPLADSNVGGVAGNQIYLNTPGHGQTRDGEMIYWSLDRRLKMAESQSGHVVSATGAIYAIRRSLFLPIPEGVTDDFVTSTRIIEQGHRLVFAPSAIAYESVSQSDDIEFRRKVRIITRGLRSVLVMRQLLNPFRFGFYAVQLMSHKVLRRLVVVPLIVLAAMCPFLWHTRFVYGLTTIFQLIFYGLGASGILLRGTRVGNLKLFSIPVYFLMVNTAALLAILNTVQGRQIALWEPARKTHVAAESENLTMTISENRV